MDYLQDHPDRPGRKIYMEGDQTWREIREEDREKARQQENKEKDKKNEKVSGSTDKTRRVEAFVISDGDDNMMIIDELMEWCLGEEVERVRMVNDRQYGRDW